MAKKILSDIDVTSAITTTGHISAGENLKSNYSSGDEGGQIFLNKAATGTTIVSGVNIDVYQNKLRFWEDGGTNRGFYLDITAGGTSVGTNLATGGGGGSGTVTSVAMTVPTGLSISGTPITSSGTLALTLTSGYAIPTTASQTNWDSAYTERYKWDGSALANGGTQATARTSLGLGTMATAASADYAALSGAVFTGSIQGPDYYSSNWFRSTGATGWYNQTYDGGIYMDNSTTVKVYNSKQFFVANRLFCTSPGSGSSGGITVLAPAGDGAPAYLQMTNNAQTAQWLAIAGTSGNATYSAGTTGGSTHIFNGKVYASGVTVANSGVFEYYGYSTSAGTTTLTNTPGTTFGYSSPSIYTSVLQSNANTAAGTVGAEFRSNTAGSRTYMITFSAGGALQGSISTLSGATAYTTSSDYRMKDNIVPMSGSIERLMLLKPSRFNFIEYPETTVDGFLAHEVQEVIPEAVAGEKDELNEDGSPSYQGIDQAKMVPLLTAALQEAILKIESLESRLEALESK